MIQRYALVSLWLITAGPYEVGFAQQAVPCEAVKSIYTAEIDVLIERSSRIVLVEDARWHALMPSRDDINKPIREGKTGIDIATAQLPVYSLTVREDLKGSGANTIMIAGKSPFPVGTASDVRNGKRPWPDESAYRDSINRHFNGHEDDAFWIDPALGRAPMGSDCEIRPMFLSGTRYLVFIGPPHVKAFEAIIEPDDKWLLHIRRVLQN